MASQIAPDVELCTPIAQFWMHTVFVHSEYYNVPNLVQEVSL